jgi:hypothetical protein
MVEQKAGGSLAAKPLHGTVGGLFDAGRKDLHDAWVIEKLVLGQVGEAVGTGPEQVDELVSLPQDDSQGQRQEGLLLGRE